MMQVKLKKNCGQNGESVFVSDEFIRMAELGEDFDHLTDWQQHEMEIAIDIEEGFYTYVQLPTKNGRYRKNDWTGTITLHL
ncbi:hypothetical protein ACFPM4_14495 [Lederbergia graminis]|uniref:Uncharacterized protein n=2 Tax=Lederbergia graminis TaxID=735518 RepID=A0ABW0LMX7_9BACI